MIQHMTSDVARRHTLSCKDVAHEAQTTAELVHKSDGPAGMVIVTAKKKKKKKGKEEGQSSKRQSNQKRRIVHGEDGLPLEVARDTKISTYASVFDACAMTQQCTTEVKLTYINLILLSAQLRVLTLCTHLGEFNNFAPHLSTTPNIKTELETLPRNKSIYAFETLTAHTAKPCIS